MVSNSSARRLTSFLLAIFAAVASAQQFGRFGYVPQTSVSGFLLPDDGFKVNYAGADEFRYEGKIRSWRPIATSEVEQSAVVSTSGLVPRKIRINLLSPGFWLYFETGFRFHLMTTQAPYLSWSEGSVGPDVPTPPQPWTLISFRDKQPPVLLSYPQGDCSVAVSGAPGQWTIHSTDTAPHWVRVSAPFGTLPQETSNAAQLGELVRRVQDNLDVWTGPAPILKSFETKEEADGVTATWHFDRVGSLIPFAASYARLGGYELEIKSGLRPLNATTEEGEMQACKDNDLTIRFPVAKIPPGKALSAEAPEIRVDPSGAVPLAQIVSLAFAELQATTSIKTRQDAQDFSSKFVAASNYSLEPFTGQQLPFDQNGTNMDRVAGAALLSQCDAIANGKSDQNNSLLLSLMLRADWSRWTIDSPDDDLSRRASALAAIAFAMTDTPQSRLQGAMLQAGLAAERGLNLWGSHRGWYAKRTFLEPLDQVRAALFYTSEPPVRDPFPRMLGTPFHIVSDLDVNASQNGNQITLFWMSRDEGPKHIQLLFAPTGILALHNVKNMQVEPGVSSTKLTILPADVGETSIRLNVLAGQVLPEFVSAPQYEEVRR